MTIAPSVALLRRRAAPARAAAPVPIRAAPPRRAPQAKAGCSCGGFCPACQADALAGRDHPAEREAEAVADQVVRMAAPAPVAQRLEEETLRRQPEEDEEEQTLQRRPEKEDQPEEEALQRQPEEEEEPLQLRAEDEDGSLQTRAEPGGAPPGGAARPAAPLAGLGAGRPLPAPLRAFFEPRFGRSFAAVRIHEGPAAQARAKALRAQAFAFGRHIVFGPGRYAPDSREGRRLIAHELTHVVQQGRAAPAVQRWTVSGDDATSDAAGDTLWGLADSVGGDGRNWPCIVPTRMQTSEMTPPPADFDAHYERYVRNGDTFDVSNLRKTSGPSLQRHFFDDARNIAITGRFYPSMTASGGEVDVEIMNAAHDGRTPIDSMILFGHAAGTSMFGGVGEFDPTELEAEATSFALANANLLPRRCWFTRSATVRSVGCNSDAFARAFARRYLRRGASITSTTAAVSPCCHGVWDRLAFTSSSVAGSTILDGPFATTAAFHAGRFWTTIAGRL